MPHKKKKKYNEPKWEKKITRQQHIQFRCLRNGCERIDGRDEWKQLKLQRTKRHNARLSMGSDVKKKKI